jgi:hypothetical protein
MSFTVFTPRLQALPSKTVALSALGLASSNPASPATGTDVSAAWQAIIDANGKGWTYIVDGTYMASVLLPSGTTIEGKGGTWYGTGTPPKCGLIIPPNRNFALANYGRYPGDGSSTRGWYTPAVSSDGAHATSGNPGMSGTVLEATPYSRVSDSDICIKHLFINFNFGTGTGQSAQGSTDAYGSALGCRNLDATYYTGTIPYSGGTAVGLNDFINPIKLYGCRNVCLEDIFTYNPGAFISGSYLDGATFLHCGAYDPTAPAIGGARPVPGRNSCVIQIEGPARCVVIDDAYGSVQDDLVALNADDGHIADATSPTAALAAFYTKGYFRGPITDCSVRNLRPTQCYDPVRLLSAYSAIDRVSVVGVRGNAYGQVGNMVGYGVPGGGAYGEITLKDWQLAFAGAAPGGLYFDGAIRSLTLDNVAIKAGGSYAFAALQSWAPFGASGTITDLMLTGCRIDGFQYIYELTAGAVTRLTVANTRHTNRSSGTTSLIQSGGTAGTLTGTGNFGLGTPGGTWTDTTTFGTV